MSTQQVDFLNLSESPTNPLGKSVRRHATEKAQARQESNGWNNGHLGKSPKPPTGGDYSKVTSTTIAIL